MENPPQPKNSNLQAIESHFTVQAISRVRFREVRPEHIVALAAEVTTFGIDEHHDSLAHPLQTLGF